MRYKVLDVQSKKERILHKCITPLEPGEERRVQIIANGKREIHYYKVLERLPDVM